MNPRPQRKGRDFIARHGETVYNRVGRMQGSRGELHTPLTREGFRQADLMGESLRHLLGARPTMTLWASPTGRTLQTLAVIAEHLELDWHAARTDVRLTEIDVGAWNDLYYRDIAAETPDAPLVDPVHRLIARRPPGGEWYDQIAARVASWLDETDDDPGDRLVIMHGISGRVMRGVMTGAEALADYGAPVAESLPQGSLVMIEGGEERLIHLGETGE